LLASLDSQPHARHLRIDACNRTDWGRSLRD
jgi:hypothetical protein